MIFLVISDIHGDIEKLKKLEPICKDVDGILFAGDFSDINKEEQAIDVLKTLCKMHDTIFAVRGNCDYPSLEKDFISSDISCERQLVMHEGLAFVGSHGCLTFTKTTPNERSLEDLQSDFNIITDQGIQEWNNLIAIMHNPPQNTDCDLISSGIHVGSSLSTDFIKNYKPLAVITGHIHESTAICKIQNTTIINPGALCEGNYALLTVCKKNNQWTIENAELKEI